MQSTQRVGVHERLERTLPQRQRLATRRNETHEAIQAVVAGTTHADFQALDGHVARDNPTTETGRKTQRWPATPSSDVKHADPPIEP